MTGLDLRKVTGRGFEIHEVASILHPGQKNPVLVITAPVAPNRVLTSQELIRRLNDLAATPEGRWLQEWPFPLRHRGEAAPDVHDQWRMSGKHHVSDMNPNPGPFEKAVRAESSHVIADLKANVHEYLYGNLPTGRKSETDPTEQSVPRGLSWDFLVIDDPVRNVQAEERIHRRPGISFEGVSQALEEDYRPYIIQQMKAHRDFFATNPNTNVQEDTIMNKNRLILNDDQKRALQDVEATDLVVLEDPHLISAVLVLKGILPAAAEIEQGLAYVYPESGHSYEIVDMLDDVEGYVLLRRGSDGSELAETIERVDNDIRSGRAQVVTGE